MQQARSVVILIFLSWSVTSGVAAQLPPEVLVDRYMVQAERLIAEHDYDAALDAMDHVAELHARHSLTVPDEFHFVYAQVALAAGVVDAALESVTRYLAAAGRSGAFYEDALTLWDEAEAEAARRVRANREAEASRQAELEAEQRREAERQQQKQREAEARRQAAAEMERQRREALGPAVFLLNFDQDQARDLVRRCPHVRPMENLEEAHFVLYGDRPIEVRDSRGALAFATVAWGWTNADGCVRVLASYVAGLGYREGGYRFGGWVGGPRSWASRSVLGAWERDRLVVWDRMGL